MRTPLEIQEKVINLYLSGKSYSEIVTLISIIGYTLSTTTVKNILEKHNIPKRPKAIKVDKAQIEKLYFQDNWTLMQISEKFGLSVNTVKKHLKDNPLYESRSKLNYKNIGMLEDYFSVIDTQNKAYILGFLIADGNVYKDSSFRVRCAVSVVDICVLEFMQKEWKTNNRIVDVDKGCVSLMVASEKMFKDLTKYGVVPNKSRITFMPRIKKEFMPHLIRGILDGDGFTSKHIKSNRYTFSHYIGFTGSESLMTSIRDYLVNELGVYNVKVVKTESTYMVLWGSKQDIIKIRDYLYKDANFYLQRKLDKIKEL